LKRYVEEHAKVLAAKAVVGVVAEAALTGVSAVGIGAEAVATMGAFLVRCNMTECSRYGETMTVPCRCFGFSGEYACDCCICRRRSTSFSQR
jgi:hypothetical protein